MQINESSVDVFSDREKFLANLRAKVRKALDNPSKVTFVDLTSGDFNETLEPVAAREDAVDTLERTEAAREDAKHLAQKNDDSIVISRLPDLSSRTGLVYVEEPFDYPSLISFFVEEFINKYRSGIEEQDMTKLNNLVVNSINHEMQHAIPALNEKYMRVFYGFEYLVDPNRPDAFAFRPCLFLEGQTTVGAFKNIVNGPDDLSVTDRIISGMNN